jgi:diaminopimelate epimerase
MGEPRLRRSGIPMRGRGRAGAVVNESLHVDDDLFKVTCVSMGNPHCVIFVPDVRKVQIERFGPRIENHPLFPERINVHFVQVVGRGEVRMRTWERGSGVTMACGTGASAVCVAGAVTGRTGRKVLAHLPGGDLELNWAADDHVYMTGPATEVFTGEWRG